MRIAIDVSPLYMSVSGISNYIRNLLRGLAVVGGEHTFILYTNKPIRVEPPLPENFVVRLVRLPFHKFQIWFQLGLPFRFHLDGADVFLGSFHRLPLFSSIPSVLTIHDLSGLVLKDYHLRSVVIRNRFIPLFVRKARRIIAISHFTKDETTRIFPRAENKVDVIPLAPAPGLSSEKDSVLLNKVRNSLSLPERYILFLGTLEPRKNLPRLLEAFASIANRVPQDLVLAGMMGWMSGPLQNLLKREDIHGRVHLTGPVDEAQLPALLTMAELMVYPSLYEGFGLPVVESMACKTPVLTSSAASLPETAGGAALLADPESVEDIAEKLFELATDSNLRVELAEKGLARVSKLSWEQTALMTLNTCRQAFDGSFK